jgi:predicted transposase YdaD
MLGLTEIDLRQTQFYQDVFTEGREEGKREESLNLVSKLLTRRLGILKSATTEQIQSLTLEQLEQLAESLLDFTCLEDLEAWLSNITQ